MKVNDLIKIFNEVSPGADVEFYADGNLIDFSGIQFEKVWDNALKNVKTLRINIGDIPQPIPPEQAVTVEVLEQYLQNYATKNEVADLQNEINNAIDIFGEFE